MLSTNSLYSSIEMYGALKILGLSCVVAVITWRLAARFRGSQRGSADRETPAEQPLLQPASDSTAQSQPAKGKQPCSSGSDSPDAAEGTDRFARIPAGLQLPSSEVSTVPTEQQGPKQAPRILSPDSQEGPDLSPGPPEPLKTLSLNPIHTAPTSSSPSPLSLIAVRGPPSGPNSPAKAASQSQPGSSCTEGLEGEDFELPRLGTAQALAREEGMPPQLPTAYSLAESLPSSSHLGIKLGSRSLSGLLDSADGVRVEQNYWSLDDEEGGNSSDSDLSGAGWDPEQRPPAFSMSSVLSSAAASAAGLAAAGVADAVAYDAMGEDCGSEAAQAGALAGSQQEHGQFGLGRIEQGDQVGGAEDSHAVMLAPTAALPTVNTAPTAHLHAQHPQDVSGCETATATPTAGMHGAASPGAEAQGSPGSLVFLQGPSPQRSPARNPFMAVSPFLAQPLAADIENLTQRLPASPTASGAPEGAPERGSGRGSERSSEKGSQGSTHAASFGPHRLDSSMQLPSSRMGSSGRQGSLPSSRLRNGSLGGSSLGSLSSSNTSTGAPAGPLRRMSSSNKRTRLQPGFEEQPCLAIKLTVVGGPCQGLEYMSDAVTTEITVGRLDTNTLVLADLEVSGQHLVIEWDPDDMCWKVADLGSLNGSLLNHYTISRAYRQPGELYKLRNGDELQLGTASKVSVCYVARDMLPDDLQARPVHVPQHLPSRPPLPPTPWGHTVSQPKSAACNGELFRCLPLGLEGSACQRVGVEHVRKSQGCEDVWGHLSPLPGCPVPASLVVLFDGHCGVAAAQQAKEHLPRHLQQTIGRHKELMQQGASLEPMWREVFAATDASVRTDEGCTGTALLVWQDAKNDGLCAQAANVGDSAAILFSLDNEHSSSTTDSIEAAIAGPRPGSQGSTGPPGTPGAPAGPVGGPLELTCEHRPRNPVELARLQALGVQVSRDGRLYGLNLSRGFGDVCLKEQDLGMTAEPHVSEVVRIHPGQRCMVVLASDGLWDVTAKERAMQVALNTYNSSFGNMRLLSQALVEHAQKQRSKDDITVVAVAIEVPEKGP